MKKSLQMQQSTLDDVDVELLRMLHEDARTSIADIARALNMSAPSVSERLRQLKECGVIQNFTIEVDPKLLGYALSFYIRIRPLPGQLEKVVAVIQAIAEIVECDSPRERLRHRVTGDDCFIAKAHVKSTNELERSSTSSFPTLKPTPL